jgi:hypothetical protein
VTRGPRVARPGPSGSGQGRPPGRTPLPTAGSSGRPAAACAALTARPRCLPQVPFGGKVYSLRVLELQPERAVSVIDTDIGCDVGPSM